MSAPHDSPVGSRVSAAAAHDSVGATHDSGAAGHDSVARELLESARVMVERASADTRGLWPRAAVVLSRQALEVALKTFWAAKALGAQDCSTRAQLLCLGAYAADEGLARRASQVWGALSRAAHVHPYELPPTRGELLTWIDGVGEVVEKTERGWRK